MEVCRMSSALRCAAALTLGCLLFASARAADWPCWRGLDNGAAPDKDLPVQITKDNVLWKLKLPGPGTSSPITFGGKMFLTCYTGYGTKITKGFSGFGGGIGGKDMGGDQKRLTLVVLCLDAKKKDLL